MTAKELERILARLTGFGSAHLDQTTRALRAAGLLPPSPRGRGATPLTGIDIATVLIALAGAEQPAKTPAAVRAYAVMVPAGSDGDAETLATTLAQAATQPEAASRIQTVLICRSWPMATISLVSPTGIEEVRYLSHTEGVARVHEAAVFCGLSGRLFVTLAERMGQTPRPETAP